MAVMGYGVLVTLTIIREMWEQIQNGAALFLESVEKLRSGPEDGDKLRSVALPQVLVRLVDNGKMQFRVFFPVVLPGFCQGLVGKAVA